MSFSRSRKIIYSPSPNHAALTSRLKTILPKNALIVFVKPMDNESVITRGIQEFSPVLSTDGVCYTSRTISSEAGDEYPWAITGAGNWRSSASVNRRAHGSWDSLE